MSMDLFEQSISERGKPMESVDLESWVWAERVIKEVNEEIALEERKSKEFIRTLIRWEEIVSFFNFIDLALLKGSGSEKSDASWHEMVCTSLLSLGGALEKWSQNCDHGILELADFTPPKHHQLMDTIRDSYDLWHRPKNAKRMASIESTLASFE